MFISKKSFYDSDVMGYISRYSYTYLNVNLDDPTKLTKDTCFLL